MFREDIEIKPLSLDSFLLSKNTDKFTRIHRNNKFSDVTDYNKQPRLSTESITRALRPMHQKDKELILQK
jgi:hypothetical protein